MADRQPLLKPGTPNEVWSADFVFDRTAEGRVLTIVDDATTEAVAIVPARCVPQILDPDRELGTSSTAARCVRLRYGFHVEPSIFPALLCTSVAL